MNSFNWNEIKELEKEINKHYEYYIKYKTNELFQPNNDYKIMKKKLKKEKLF